MQVDDGSTSTYAGQFIKIVIGNQIAEKQLYWAKTSDRERRLIKLDKRLLDLFFRDPGWFRRDEIFTMQRDQIKEIDVQSGKSAFGLEFVEDGWRFKSDVASPVDQELVALALDKLLALKIDAKHFVSNSNDNLTSYGLQPAKNSISLKTRDGKTQTMNNGKSGPKGSGYVFARVVERVGVFGIPHKDVFKFYWLKNDFRLKKVFDLKSDEIHKIILRQPGAPRQAKAFILERKEAFWQLQIGADGTPVSIPSARPVALCDSIANLKYERKVEKFGIGDMALDPPSHSIEIYDEDDLKIYIIDIGVMSHKEYLVRVDRAKYYKINAPRISMLVDGFVQISDAHVKKDDGNN